MGSPEAPSLSDVRSELQVDTASPGFPQAYGGAGARHVRHFISGILLPNGYACFGATNRVKFDAHFLAGVDGRIEAFLRGRHVSRPAGTCEDLECPAPVRVEVDVWREAVDYAELGLLDRAVVLQVGFSTVGQLGLAVETIDTKGRDDL
ncbi:hypothetical protein D3C76_1146580 [compost metagenome]